MGTISPRGSRISIAELVSRSYEGQPYVIRKGQEPSMGRGSKARALQTRAQFTVPNQSGLNGSQVQPRMKIIRQVHGTKTCPRASQEASLWMKAPTNRVCDDVQALQWLSKTTAQLSKN